MAFEDVIAQRYQGYISIEELVKMIAIEYECSEKDALMVLSDAIKSNSSRGIQGEFVCDLSLYRKERLGPKRVDSFIESEVLENLCGSDISMQEGLEFVIPF